MLMTHLMTRGEAWRLAAGIMVQEAREQALCETPAVTISGKGGGLEVIAKLRGKMTE